LGAVHRGGAPRAAVFQDGGVRTPNRGRASRPLHAGDPPHEAERPEPAGAARVVAERTRAPHPRRPRPRTHSRLPRPSRTRRDAEREEGDTGNAGPLPRGPLPCRLGRRPGVGLAGRQSGAEGEAPPGASRTGPVPLRGRADGAPCGLQARSESAPLSARGLGPLDWRPSRGNSSPSVLRTSISRAAWPASPLQKTASLARSL